MTRTDGVEGPAWGGMQIGLAAIVPINVFHSTTPVLAFTAYSYPFHAEKYATPPVTIGAGTITLPTLKVQRGLSDPAVAGEIVVSLDAFVRERSCIGVGQSSLVAEAILAGALAAAGAGADTSAATPTASARKSQA